MKNYDVYIIAFSGGKDSISSFLHLLEIGIPIGKIELWHHDIDGRGETFMDWEITPSYCQAFADSFGVPLYFSWKEGGFKREMLRENTLTAPNYFMCPDGNIMQNKGGVSGKRATRRKFPQVSADLSVRWCSAYLKIDVGTSAICSQKRFNNKRVLFISGERGEESKARSQYSDFEIDRADNRFKGSYINTTRRNVRFKKDGIWKKELRDIQSTITIGKANRVVDRWRPIKTWSESQVWDIIKKYRVRVHPCYYMGWSRCSCKFCIFGNEDQFASANELSPKIGQELIYYEDQFGKTMKRNISLRELISLGTPYKDITAELARLATSSVYDQQIIMNPNEWYLPAGAFGESCGPI